MPPLDRIDRAARVAQVHAHLRPAAFENDRERDAELHAAGYLVLRFTWRQLTERPEWVAAKLLRAYSRGVAQI